MKSTHQSIKGIYLQHYEFGESSLILLLYTSDFGSQKFVVKGAKNKKGLMAILQPLHFIEVECRFNPDKDLNSAYKCSSYKYFKSIPLNLYKSTVALFLGQLLFQTIQQKEPSKLFYEYLESTICWFDEAKFNASFHLLFMVGLMRYLGIQPTPPEISGNKLFNTEKGTFEIADRQNHFHLGQAVSELLIHLISLNIERLESFKISNQLRKELIVGLVLYFEVQMELKRGVIDAHLILEEVLT